jgi:hypothetical protein
LSKILAEQSNIKFDELSLVRRIHTPMHRAGMDGKARAASVENAFEVKRPKFIKGAKVLLVDDVFTSGATVSNLRESSEEKRRGKSLRFHAGENFIVELLFFSDERLIFCGIRLTRLAKNGIISLAPKFFSR